MSIERTRSIDNPLRAYNWEVHINGPSFGGLEGLYAYAQTAQIPEESVDTFEINHKSEKTIHPGRVASARTLTVTFFDDEQHTVLRYIKRWQDIIKNQQTGSGVDRSLFSAEIVIKMLENDTEQTVAEHVFSTAFVSSRGEVSLSYDSSEPFTFDVTFTFQTHDIR